MKLDPEDLKVAELTGGIIEKKDALGNIIGWKGPWLPHYYDNYTECLRENQWEKRRLDNEKLGRNFDGQTPEEEKKFKREMEVAKKRKEKAELAAEMALQNK